jgi:hypothetical protein
MTDSGPRESRVKKWSAGGPFTTIMVTTTSHPQRGGGGGRLIEMTCEARFTSGSVAARTPAACLEALSKSPAPDTLGPFGQKNPIQPDRTPEERRPGQWSVQSHKPHQRKH